MNIFIITVIVFMALSSNISPSKSQWMFNQDAEFRFRLFLKIDHIRSIGEKLTEDMNKRYEEFNDDLFAKCRCELNVKKDEIQVFVSKKKEETGDFPIYKECSDKANLKLRLIYEKLTRIQCAFEDLWSLNYATKQIENTVDAGGKTLNQFDEAVFQCQINNVDITSCNDQVISNMTNKVKIIDLQEENAGTIDTMMRANLHNFPCVDRYTRVFRRHLNTIKARAELCITNKNTTVLEYTKWDLLPPGPKDLFDNCSH